MWSKYTNEKEPRLKYKFKDCEKIKNNYSQACQDMFVLMMLDGKKNGSYLEIGANEPIDISNTYLLESEFDWSGLSIDIVYNEKFDKIRKNEYLISDALKIDYNELLKKYKFPNQIDYLSIDIEPSINTFDCLKMLPLDEYRFSVITFEHDFYAGDPHNVREDSRKFLSSFGYKLVCSNVSNHSDIYPFEDWYVDPNVVNSEIFESVINTSTSSKFCENFLLNDI